MNPDRIIKYDTPSFDKEIYKEVKRIENRRIEEARKLKNEIEKFIEKL